MFRFWISVVLLTLFLPGSIQAATWRVEKDGSGDFTVVQDASDAAASGDTILVGEGWFEHYREYSYPVGDIPIYFNKLVAGLTIIGSGMDVTHIGPRKDDTWGNFDSQGITASYDIPDGELRIENLTLSNVSVGLQIETGSLILKNVALRHCYRGVFSLGSMQIQDCEISDIAYVGLSANSGSHDVIVENCFFENCHRGFSFRFTQNVSVRNSQFLGCGEAGMFDLCTGEMWNCLVSDAFQAGVSISGLGEFHFYDNQVNSAHYNVLVIGADNLLCEDNIFSGTDRQCIAIYSSTPIFHNNHILKESGFAVYIGGFIHEPAEYVDMTNNYWGTDNPDSISAWISDANDNYSGPMNGYVDFSPFSDVPLPTGKPSLGGLKAMFR